MAETITLTAADGHRLAAYRATPAGKPLAALVVVQEIFGITRHIREVAEQYAAEGYVSIAPAFFDRVQSDVELPYTEIARGREIMQALKPEQVMLDLRAGVAAGAGNGRVGVVGYCWGGTIAYRAACELQVAAAVSYYGSRIPQYLDKKPRCPVMYHFGEKDQSTPPEAIEQIRAADPAGIFYTYPAGHGFNCTDRVDYEPQSAALAFERSLAFLRKHIG